MELRKASKKKARLRIGLSGASGFGKTYSALLIAYGIAGDWNKIAIIDTENKSADFYEDVPYKLGFESTFNTLELTAPYSPERYNEAIHTCEKSGIEVIIVDSITHEWDGDGGCLQIADEVTQASNSKNSYMSWAKVTPRHNSFIQTILKSPCHIITTVRRKQEYDLVKNDRGKTEVVKLGMKEITRDGFEYELTLNFEFLGDAHYVKASKDRTGLFMNKPEFVPTIETGKQLKNWADSGIDEVKFLLESLALCTDRNSGFNLWNTNTHLQTNQSVIDAFKEFGKKYPKSVEN